MSKRTQHFKIQSQNDDWKRATIALKLLLSAIDSLGINSSLNDVREAATVEYIEAVTWACTIVPDGRLFSDAVNRGEAL